MGNVPDKAKVKKITIKSVDDSNISKEVYVQWSDGKAADVIRQREPEERKCEKEGHGSAWALNLFVKDPGNTSKLKRATDRGRPLCELCWSYQPQRSRSKSNKPATTTARSRAS